MGLGRKRETVTILAPSPITATHELGAFDCGHTSLNEWLQRRALNNHNAGATRTYVVAEGRRVIAYHALAAGAVAADATPGSFRRNMPDPVPVVVWARVAVDQSWAGKGLGRALFRDAALRSQQAAHLIGIRGILVHALNDDAKNFYLTLGFQPSPLDPMSLVVPMAAIERVLDG